MTDSRIPLLVLSSSSPARRALLKRLPLPHAVFSPDIDETPLPDEDVKSMVRRLAELKARKAASAFPGALVIGCDQVGILEDTVLCKPLTHETAVHQLRRMSGKAIRFYTAICLFDTRNQQLQSAIEIYDVHFRELSDARINQYLQHEKPYHCAGSFQAEGLGVVLINQFHGDDYTALIGLPLIRLVDMLEKAGVNPLGE
ncbi:Maf-like protein YceF [Aquicella siphonis]|uniref:Nucleoside triphosphate pyrophosphatase n=1 Tax=Aquicella siphonis TaxID=254247 RepID=A0A5E4PIE7_9COXI|nr:nucleoside triphosphate pyrophosphatase [Aquicella siphonis]VVC76724.1 Maf-like protein YceF [Aquicella siphonis]